MGELGFLLVSEPSVANSLQRFQVAVHEAGHVVVCRMVGLAVERAELFLEAEGTEKGRTTPDQNSGFLSVRDQGDFFLAGIAAQKLMFGETSDQTGWRSDLDKFKQLDLAEGDGLERRLADLVDRLAQERPVLNAVALALLNDRSLDAPAIEAVFASTSEE